DVKSKVLSDLAEINGESTIYASNTSSIPLTQIAASFKYPTQVVGIHYFNPAHIMKLVEVISAEQTSAKVLEQAIAYVKSVGKKCIVAKDAPGFIVNRVARHFYVEGLKVLEENVANHDVIDDLVRSSGFKMGPFQLMDLIGVETNLSVTESMYQLFNYDQKFRPNRIQQKKVQAGYYGRKSGKGFYTYDK
ncbi:MAG: 3-hydroxybutyryl-CoA dehydrogenase, partial [Bacteroidia bacterium]|nr:3-hydroxybutyryl-CoA dehydrogenase [Bacteroidia bacterium]